MQFIADEPKVGRNEPCPCGSGQKYKRCCWLADQRGVPVAPRPTRTAGYDRPRGLAEAFTDFAAPLLQIADSEEGLKKAMSMAALCYDLGLILDDDERERAIEEAVMAVAHDERSRVGMRKVIDNMLERHRLVFPRLHARKA